MATAPNSCATIRPMNEIQADRTLDFFFFLSGSVCSPEASGTSDSGYSRDEDEAIADMA